MNTIEKPFVSIIVPVFNDTERLRHCLNALQAQTYPRDRYEIIIADNGSNHDVAAALGNPAGVTVVVERTPGSYAARNAALPLARGEVLAFTDADCVPHNEWLARGVARLQAHPEAGLVAGVITLFFHDAKRPTAVELYESLTAFPQHKYVAKYHYGATANVFTWRRVMDAIGPFNAALTSGGDREWGQRVYAAGLPLVYAEEVQVQHPARRSFGELSHKVVRVTKGMETLRRKQAGSFPAFAKDTVKDLLPPLGKIRSIWADSRLRGAKQRCQVTGVMLGLRYTKAWARIRARTGGLQHVR